MQHHPSTFEECCRGHLCLLRTIGKKDACPGRSRTASHYDCQPDYKRSEQEWEATVPRQPQRCTGCHLTERHSLSSPSSVGRCHGSRSRPYIHWSPHIGHSRQPSCSRSGLHPRCHFQRTSYYPARCRYRCRDRRRGMKRDTSISRMGSKSSSVRKIQVRSRLRSVQNGRRTRYLELPEWSIS